MPTTGEYAAREAEVFPRANYWDVFAAHTTATTLHFADFPTLAAMVCAEGSHLYLDDARIFTRWLAETLRTRAILSPAPGATAAL